MNRLVMLVDEGLGNTAYLVDLGDGRALAVDVSRDLRAVRTAAAQRGLLIAYAADTHLHADFLSGAVQLSTDAGARILASAGGGREFPHTGLGDGDEVDLGGLRLRTLATPGHTTEHVAFELLDGAETLGIFTGGSLIVGAAARTDLVAPERTEELARLQYRSLRRLAAFGDDVAVWPTHGGGSFCSAPPGAERTSTIGAERAANPLLGVDENEFVSRLLGSLGSFPTYFRRLGELNRRGPTLLGDAALTTLSVAEFNRLRAAGAEVLDVRPAAAFAAGHVPGSLSNTLRPAFATWLGWLVDDDRPLLVVRDPDQDPAEILGQAAKVGYDRVVGELTGGVRAWTDAGHPAPRLPMLGAEQLADRQVLDVRQDAEFAAGHVPGALHVELGELAGRAASVPAGPTVVMCGHGERAMTGASLLARAGHRGLAVLDGGPDEWTAATGRPLHSGLVHA
jgi:glyoxylase-like metal-dependent hydrolase (beta-lactamase superfamily II)/rhodanese-related sulfurtransferase